MHSHVEIEPDTVDNWDIPAYAEALEGTLGKGAAHPQGRFSFGVAKIELKQAPQKVLIGCLSIKTINC
jgi:hypothetical protein